MSEQVQVEIELGEILKNYINEKLGVRKDAGGKGEALPTANVNRLGRIVESLKRGSLREQWMRPVSLPFKPTASVLSYIGQTDAIQGQMGDVVQIPIVKPFDCEVLSSVGASWSGAITGAYATIQTTLYEAGGYMEIPYADIEKLSESLLSELEAQFENGIVRAIDGKIFSIIAGTANLPILDKSGAATYFDADWIPEGLHKILTSGKEANPTDFILCLTPYQYSDLYKDIVGSQALVYARPDVVREGVVAEFMGVKILVSNNLPTYAANAYWAFLINKNSVIFAPKREMLFELEKDTVARKAKLTGSYTFGFVVADKDAICGIKTKAVS